CRIFWLMCIFDRASWFSPSRSASLPPGATTASRLKVAQKRTWCASLSCISCRPPPALVDLPESLHCEYHRHDCADRRHDPSYHRRWKQARKRGAQIAADACSNHHRQGVMPDHQPCCGEHDDGDGGEHEGLPVLQA